MYGRDTLILAWLTQTEMSPFLLPAIAFQGLKGNMCFQGFAAQSTEGERKDELGFGFD